MKTIITNKCKDYIFNAEDGIKFQIKGYAFLIDKEYLVQNADEESLKNLLLKDLYRKNPTEFEETIVYDPTKSKGGDILNRLFDTTYVPSLEASTNDDYCFGTYTFKVDKGLDPKNPDGFVCETYNCDKFDAILVIGQKFSENQTYVEELEKSFLAAIILKDDDSGFTTNDNELITWQFGLASTDASSVSGVSDFYDDIGEFTLHDNQTTELSSTKPLFLVSMSGLNYDEEINSIIHNTDSAESATFSGNYLPENIILTDETEKINNLWNVSSTVTIFDKHDSLVAKPQLMLSYNDTYKVNSIAFTYDRSKSIFTLNPTNGCDNIQVDLFPENLHIENQFCVDPEIKPFNHTTISSWSACSGNSRFFKLNSNGGRYSSGSFDTVEFNSNHNILSEYNEATTFINSNRNELVNTKDLTLLNTDDSTFECVSDAISIGTYNTNVETTRTDLKDKISGHTYIGTNGLNTLLTSFGTTNGITVIGNNSKSQFVDAFSGYIAQNYRDLGGNRVTAEIFNVTDFRHIKGSVQTTGGVINVEYNANIFKYNTAYYPDEYLKNDYASLIGFNGLILNKNFYTNTDYTGRTYDGYSKSLNESHWTVEGTPTAVSPNDYTVTFGSYNAYTNPYILNKDGSVTSINSYLYKLYDTSATDTDVSSIYVLPDGTSKVYDSTVQSAKPFILYFRNHQDSINTRNDWEFYRIGSDEGDYSLNKIVVVGAGEQYKTDEQMLFTPAENVAKNYGLDSIGKRIDLFSIEQNSFQLVHNNNYDMNPHFSATQVLPIPGMFAVRGWEPVTQKYLYKFSTSAVNNGTQRENMFATINKYNLQNAIYTPSAILFPLQRSSNDEYKLGLNHIQDYIKGNTITGVTKKLIYTDLKTEMDNFVDKRQTFVYRTKGIKSLVKGIKGNVAEWRHKLYIEDVFTGLSKKGVNIKSSGLKGINSKVYTIYLVNDNPIHTLTFKGLRMRKVGANYQTLMATKYIHPGMTQRIMYLDNGSNGEYGVMNFDYYNPNNNTYMTR